MIYQLRGEAQTRGACASSRVGKVRYRSGYGPLPTALSRRRGAAKTQTWPPPTEAPAHMVHGALPSSAAPRPCGCGRRVSKPDARLRRATIEEVRGQIQRKGCWGARLTSSGLCPSWPWSFSFGPGAQALQERGMDEGRIGMKERDQGEGGDPAGARGPGAGPA